MQLMLISCSKQHWGLLLLHLQAAEQVHAPLWVFLSITAWFLQKLGDQGRSSHLMLVAASQSPHGLIWAGPPACSQP